MHSSFGLRYWEERYSQRSTGWDIGDVSPPLKEYFDSLSNHEISILIPGAGNAYEAEYLYDRGFTQVTVLDIARQPLIELKKRNANIPHNRILHRDFFMHKGKYDLLVEQAFFCAIDPALRFDYVKKSYDLLKEGGKIMGLLWAQPMNLDTPPFGGTLEEYKTLFNPYFTIEVMEIANNSIKPRQGRELFILLTKKS